MIHPFLITGLPRSRTAWMAAAATFDNAICLHEPTRHLSQWDDIFRTIWRKPKRSILESRKTSEFIGISDHGLGFHLPEILFRTKPRTLIIERPIEEVNASLSAIGLPSSNFCNLLLEPLSYDHPLIRRVAYADLADTDTVVSCLEWLMPGAKIKRRRIALLQRENIQADIDETLRIAAARASDMWKFIPHCYLHRLAVTP